MRGRKRHGGRRANRGTPPNALTVGQPSLPRMIVRKFRRRFGATWYTGNHVVHIGYDQTCTARELYDFHKLTRAR